MAEAKDSTIFVDEAMEANEIVSEQPSASVTPVGSITGTDAKRVIQMDSFEKMEAAIQKETDENDSQSIPGFTEDYGLTDDTNFDKILEANSRVLRKQPKVDELFAMEYAWSHPKEAELDEKTLERLEVAALIKKAEEKLLPVEKEVVGLPEVTIGDEEAVAQCIETPELKTLQKIVSAAELTRTDSSDQSEEGFRLRLSCILEESESDASLYSNIPKLSSVAKPETKEEIREVNLDSGQEIEQNVTQNAVGQSCLETLETNTVLDHVQEIADSQKCSAEIAVTKDDVTDIQQNIQLDPIDSGQKIDPRDSIESTSPEPSFGIRRLKSGTTMESLLTSISAKRLESSSESSLDFSVSTTSPGGEDTPKTPDTLFLESLDKKSDTENLQKVQEDLGELAAESEIKTSPVNTEDKKINDITEMTEADVDEMFPKVARRSRGVSLSHDDRKNDDTKSVKSCHMFSTGHFKEIFSKVRKSKRGRSLESGMTEKQAEDKRKKTTSEKDEKPPVPPETYLWEELRRWRMKGGYPWTYLDKPPFDEKTSKYNEDHEYEPINPPAHETSSNRITSNDQEATTGFLRIPQDEDIIVDDVSPEDMEVEAIAKARQFQDDLEDRFLATPLTTTTASRTDCDVNTSMLDSSGLEDLPLQRGSRSKKALQSKTEQMRAQAQGLQQRIRSQAGKLRSKLRSIPRPTFPKKQDKPKVEGEEKSRFRINLPDRPKLSFPDRSKFKMPQKPKINLSNFTKPLRERQAQGKTSTEPKKNVFDINFSTYPRMFNKKSKDRGEYATSSPKMTRAATPPPAPVQPVARKKGPVGQRWANRFDDIKFADDRASELSQRSDRTDPSESFSDFHDKDFAIADDLEAAQLPPPRALSTKSSLSHHSDRETQSSRGSLDHHRKGVLEEIDPDQFFLRQRGISDDDIDMGKYLSEEIREAFKGPVVNALRQLDLDYEEEEDGKENEPDPLPPSRNRSLKRTPKSKSTDEENPPHIEAVVVRAGHVEELSKPKYENIQTEAQPTRYENIEDNVSEYYKTPPPPQEYQHYQVPRTTPKPAKRKGSDAEQSTNKKRNNGWVEVEIETELEEVETEEPPKPLQRRKSKKEPEKQSSSELPQEQEQPSEPVTAPQKKARSLSRGATTRSNHSIVQNEAPIPPKRTSSRSIHSIGLAQEPIKKDSDNRSIHSLAMYDKPAVVAPKRAKSLSRTSRSIQSLTNTASSPIPPERKRSLSRLSHDSRSYHSFADDERSWVPQAPDRTRSLSRSKKSKQSSLPVHEYEVPSEDNYPGYAVVEKPKPPRPPPPRRQKRSISPNFNTFPRHSPISPTRPLRNYATLGPSRPPRRTRPKPARSLEHIYTSDQMSQSYIEVTESLKPSNTEDTHGSSKDLQAIDVVEKMKGRPLPAPPRPPRHKSRSEDVGLEEVEEVCAGTQTDPLPDDMCMEDDIIQEFSHEQLRVQEAFLKEMREEEERIQREIESRRARNIDVTTEKEENDAKMEIIRQMNDIIQEERRLLLGETQRPDDRASRNDEEDKKKKSEQLEVYGDDLGYASLDRRQKVEEEPQPSTSFQRVTEPQSTEQAVRESIPSTSLAPVYVPLVPEIINTERLRVGHLEVDRLTVNSLEANLITSQDIRSSAISVQDVRGTSLQIQDIASQSGNLALRNIELPPEFIEQLIARIPWDQLRPPVQIVDHQAETTQTTEMALAVEEPSIAQAHVSSTRRRHRTIRSPNKSQYSSDEDAGHQVASRRHRRLAEPPARNESTIPQLTQKLAQACTSAGMAAIRDVVDRVQNQDESQRRNAQTILVVFIVAIAGYILLSIAQSGVHIHHWDFQFPPQPPRL